jgi:hypothetical protein
MALAPSLSFVSLTNPSLMVSLTPFTPKNVVSKGGKGKEKSF